MRSRRARGTLNREQVIAAAFLVAESVGLADLSMPGVAQHLDVGVTSLYWHVRSKDELIEALTELATGIIDETVPLVAAPPLQPWMDHVIAQWTAYRSALRARPILADLTILRTGGIPSSAPAAKRRAARIDHEVAVLRGAGFSDAAARRAYAALAVFTRGSILNERLYLLAGRPSDAVVDPAEDFTLDWEAVPRLLASAPHWTHSLAGDADFAYGLQVIVGGFAETEGVAA
ncbi:MAG: TetR family transcriptional regulator [Actinomycetia bacterium]|nr:TetR family transcriptional regulator [Actinomycetes bacterium]